MRQRGVTSLLGEQQDAGAEQHDHFSCFERDVEVVAA
jgi:hypothetical protein